MFFPFLYFTVRCNVVELSSIEVREGDGTWTELNSFVEDACGSILSYDHKTMHCNHLTAMGGSIWVYLTHLQHFTALALATDGCGKTLDQLSRSRLIVVPQIDRISLR